MSMAQQAFVDSRRILKHKSLPLACKLNLARCLIFTKLLYAAETWTGISDVVMRKLDAFILKVCIAPYSIGSTAKTGNMSLTVRFGRALPHRLHPNWFLWQDSGTSVS